MKYEAAVNAYRVYEDETEFVGHAQVSLPNLSALKVTINGSGIMGNVDVALIGSFEPMTLTLNFRLMSKAVVSLNSPRRHNLTLYIAQQHEDSVQGAVISDTVKHVFIAQPLTLTAGTVAPASANDGSIAFAVRYWAQYINGEKVLEIDPLNRICFMDGKDWLQPIRAALGE